MCLNLGLINVSSSEYGITKPYAGCQVSDRCLLGYLFLIIYMNGTVPHISGSPLINMFDYNMLCHIIVFQLSKFVADERKKKTIYPTPENVFSWTRACDIEDVSIIFFCMLYNF